ncbi:50S ribosomal protein L13 [Hondaea fermentalgiana]|uniref:50S ribosomal protein L13 n=1 Tax=Hondaea fermentalgiana TaxID=2315210 RepID=A0A2R5GDL4_9STRA|nr:50S ribosomal protein L13 [Hondaea fermentalgiana]|eukprot:GBG26733.1 50S ribosomal protein L13 [Hondaea fermentalgiana]
MSCGKSRMNHVMWHFIDAREQVVGRMATRIIPLIMGKHKPTFSPHLDNGDNVVVVNAEDMRFSGRKFDQKLYRWHTGYPGGFRSMTPRDLVERKGRPEELLERAVNGMLPKNRLRKQRMQRLRIYQGADFPELSHFTEEQQEQIAEMLARTPEPYMDGAARRKAAKSPPTLNFYYVDESDGEEKILDGVPLEPPAGWEPKPPK